MGSACICSKNVIENEKVSSPVVLDGVRLSSSHLSLINRFCGIAWNHTWLLIYRATIDGFTADDFHRKCDARSNQVIIIRTREGCVFGGYTQIGFRSSGSRKCDDQACFLFTLVNSYSIGPSRLAAPIDHRILNDRRRGPLFGRQKELWIGNKYGDLRTGKSQISLLNGHGEYLLAGQRTFQIDQIEVYVM